MSASGRTAAGTSRRPCGFEARAALRDELGAWLDVLAEVGVEEPAAGTASGSDRGGALQDRTRDGV